MTEDEAERLSGRVDALEAALEVVIGALDRGSRARLAEAVLDLQAGRHPLRTEHEDSPDLPDRVVYLLREGLEPNEA